MDGGVGRMAGRTSSVGLMQIMGMIVMSARTGDGDREV